jgi:hypothetical protein
MSLFLLYEHTVETIYGHDYGFRFLVWRFCSINGPGRLQLLVSISRNATEASSPQTLPNRTNHGRVIAMASPSAALFTIGNFGGHEPFLRVPTLHPQQLRGAGFRRRRRGVHGDRGMIRSHLADTERAVNGNRNDPDRQ